MNPYRLSKVYRFLHFVSRFWLWWLAFLVFLTLLFGSIGAGAAGGKLSGLSRLYLACQFFALNGPMLEGEVPGPVEVARWLGFLVWFSAIGAVVVRLFHQRLLTILVSLLARDHVIVAGLGPAEDRPSRLIARLCEQGMDVVVIEPDQRHLEINTCRDAGAIVLTGVPANQTQLARAGLARASHFLILFADDRSNLEAAQDAYECLRPKRSARESDEGAVGKLRCVVQVAEPGLQEVLRKHVLYTNPHDRIQVAVFNQHEVTARVMLRQATVRTRQLVLQKILLVGSGKSKRLGEMLIVRAAKDYWLERQDAQAPPEVRDRLLEIHVCDKNANQWVNDLRNRYPLLNTVCTFEAHDCRPHRCGFRPADSSDIVQTGFHAVFVCLEDEPRALVQAAHLAEAFEHSRQRIPPIIVRVLEREHGCGALLKQPKAAGLKVVSVGVRDHVFDHNVALAPETELLAMAAHEEFLRKTRLDITQAIREGAMEEAGVLEAKSSVTFWTRLDLTFLQSNRALVDRLKGYLSLTHPEKKPRRYRLEGFADALAAGNADPLFWFSADEIEFLAEQEHKNWCHERQSDGWTYGPRRNDKQKIHNYLVDWNKLPHDVKEYNRELIRRMPIVFANADLAIVPVGKR